MLYKLHSSSRKSGNLNYFFLEINQLPFYETCIVKVLNNGNSALFLFIPRVEADFMFFVLNQLSLVMGPNSVSLSASAAIHSVVYGFSSTILSC